MTLLRSAEKGGTMEIIFALPTILLIGTAIYVVSLLHRIAKAVERVAINTERKPSL